MKKEFVVLGFVMCFFGLTLGFVYYNPFGYVVDGLGFMFFMYGLFARESHERDSFYPKTRSGLSEERDKCGNCANFETILCPRKEKLINADACEKFLPYSGKRNP